MKNLLFITLLLLSFAFSGLAQTITIDESQNVGFFMVDSVDYVKGNFQLKYTGRISVDTLRKFSLVNIYTGEYLINSRYFDEVDSVDTWNELSQKLETVGAIGIVTEIDAVTNSLMTVAYEHHEIHSGNHYLIQKAETIGSGDSICFVVKTPNTTKWAHFLFSVSSSAQASLHVMENYGSAVGDTLTAVNNNRNSDNVSGLVFEVNPTSPSLVSADTLAVHFLGSGTNPSQARTGSGTRSEELLLKQDTKYLFEIKSQSASNRIDLEANWYEHTSK